MSEIESKNLFIMNLMLKSIFNKVYKTPVIPMTKNNINNLNNINNINIMNEKEENSLITPSKENLINKFKIINLLGNKRKKNSNSIPKEKEKEKEKPKIKGKGRTIKHTKFGKDNIIRKIQIHFFTFLFDYVNYKIKKILDVDHQLFSKIDYELKINIRRDNIEKLKKLKISDILVQKASNKNKTIRKTLSNIEVYEKIKSLKNEEIDNLLNKNYLEMFTEIYLKPRNCIEEKLSKNVKIFEDLIEKESENIKIDEISKKEFYLLKIKKIAMEYCKNKEKKIKFYLK